MLPINKLNAQLALHALAEANGVTDAQMASYFYRHFYSSTKKMTIAAKMHRHAIAIANLTSQI